MKLVPGKGVEPLRLTAYAPQTYVSANSTIPANPKCHTPRTWPGHKIFVGRRPAFGNYALSKSFLSWIHGRADSWEIFPAATRARKDLSIGCMPNWTPVSISVAMRCVFLLRIN